MSSADFAFLQEEITNCRNGLGHWDTLAWYFIHEISENHDASPYTIAPDEVKAIISAQLDELAEKGHYRRIIPETGKEVDHSERLALVSQLLLKAGYRGHTPSQ